MIEKELLETIEKQIVDLLIESRSCGNKESSMDTLKRAERLCKQMAGNNPKRYELMVEVFSDLAENSSLPSERKKFWQDCVSEAFRGTDKFNDASLASCLARKTVDFVQDPHVTISTTEGNHLLARAREKVDYFLDRPSTCDHSHLLARKSSLLRNMSRFRATRIAQENVSEEAFKCANKAAKENPDSWDAYLELALSVWHLAQFQKGDKEYHKQLNLAEEYFWKSVSLKPTVYNLLSICRFFRNTYQTNPFLECFNRYCEIEYNKRRLLQESYLFGEGVMQLWYSQYPQKVIEDYLQDADQLLEKAIDAKYSDARHIVDLAFIKAAKGEINVGDSILHTLHSLSKDTLWTEIAECISKISSSDDLISRGFALGIADSSIWTRLGTFIIDFHHDLQLGIDMHRVALRQNPGNAIAMTNLARALLEIDTSEAIQEAERWISKAASCADRRFRWWRNVREQIKQKLQQILAQEPPQIQEAKKSVHLKQKSLSDLSRTYMLLKTLENPQTRGFKLEGLMKRLFDISLGNSFASYRTTLKWTDNPIMQIDAGFSFFNLDQYRVETKWTSNPVTHSDIILFHEKLDVAEVKGLFISISGFTPQAIKKTCELCKERQILLMDGEEIELILQGCPPFDEALRLKQIHLVKDSNPYFKIKPTIQV